MADETEIFDAKFLGRLRTLFFKLRKRRKLNRKGAQSTPSSGFTREFKDYRHYTPGDDYRAIDWRLYARLDRLFIRIFEEVQEYHVHILVDRSQSMREPHPEKRVVALQVAAALAYLALANQHRVSLLSLGDDVRRELPPLKGQGHIHEILKHLAGLEYGGVTNLVKNVQSFRPGRGRRGLIFLLSDLFGASTADSEQCLGPAGTWPAETHLIQILHPDEMRPPLEGEIRLEDVETGEHRRIWLTDREIRRYVASFDDYRENLKRAALRRQIGYVTWTTDESFEDMFVELLARGTALAGS